MQFAFAKGIGIIYVVTFYWTMTFCHKEFHFSYTFLDMAAINKLKGIAYPESLCSNLTG